MKTLKALRLGSKSPLSSIVMRIRDWEHQKITNVYGKPQMMEAACSACRDA